MLHHLLDSLEAAGAARQVVVVGARREQVEASVAPRGVDIAHSGNAFTQRETCFVDHRHQHAINDEAGCVVCKHQLLTQCFAILANDVDSRIGRRQSADDFNQAHDSNRV